MEEVTINTNPVLFDKLFLYTYSLLYTYAALGIDMDFSGKAVLILHSKYDSNPFIPRSRSSEKINVH